MARVVVIVRRGEANGGVAFFLLCFCADDVFFRVHVLCSFGRVLISLWLWFIPGIRNLKDVLICNNSCVRLLRCRVKRQHCEAIKVFAGCIVRCLTVGMAYGASGHRKNVGVPHGLYTIGILVVAAAVSLCSSHVFIVCCCR